MASSSRRASVQSSGAVSGSKLMEIRITDLMTIFFVRDFGGNRACNDKKEFTSLSFLSGDGALNSARLCPMRLNFVQQNYAERCFVQNCFKKSVAELGETHSEDPKGRSPSLPQMSGRHAVYRQHRGSFGRPHHSRTSGVLAGKSQTNAGLVPASPVMDD